MVSTIIDLDIMTAPVAADYLGFDLQKTVPLVNIW